MPPPNKASGERLIEIIMRSGRSGIEHRQLLAINLVFATKKSNRLLIEPTCLSEIKRGSATVFSYQELMVASQDSRTNLN